MPGGQPTRYRDHYPELLIQKMGREGLSVVRFCALPELEIHKDTFFEWCKVHPLFSDSYAIAKAMCEAYWEKEVLNLWQAEKVNTALVRLYMANRFKWTERVDNTVTATISHEMSIKDLD